MNEVVESLIEEKKPRSVEEFENILKEAIQQIALVGLWRAKFFEKAAFFGGSALRILHGLNRFSEDLDFSLLNPRDNFDFKTYGAAVVAELESYDFSVTLEKRDKSKESDIETAFVQGVSQIHLSKIDPKLKTQHNRLLKVKIEIETKPPGFSQTEVSQHFFPITFSIRSYSLPDLFAGKIHAVLFRPRIHYVKGRDWYDFLWFIGRKVPVRLAHLRARMINGRQWPENRELSLEALKDLLRNKIKTLDVTDAKDDIARFLKNPSDLDDWSRELFVAAVERIRAV